MGVIADNSDGRFFFFIVAPPVMIASMIAIALIPRRERRALELMQLWAAENGLQQFTCEECGLFSRPLFFGGRGAIVRRFAAQRPDGTHCSGWLRYRGWPWQMDVRWEVQKTEAPGFPVILP